MAGFALLTLLSACSARFPEDGVFVSQDPAVSELVSGAELMTFAFTPDIRGITIEFLDRRRRPIRIVHSESMDIDEAGFTCALDNGLTCSIHMDSDELRMTYDSTVVLFENFVPRHMVAVK
jgi:hypothetical protein